MNNSKIRICQFIKIIFEANNFMKSNDVKPKGVIVI